MKNKKKIAAVVAVASLTEKSKEIISKPLGWMKQSRPGWHNNKK